ncbi:AmmeMemoRadiSam system protein B [candidate division KSB1 bacterium]|nr:AmmeMemoRadiSam system protein B [candidate division KSB1 bacterium]RQW07194.1 MAG: AmmeMemoRadiSam system protein B [candidate division KSB1 bacterium]
MRVRHAAWADQFYPGNADQLKQIINSYLQMSEKLGFERIVGLVSPHAGYVFSGRTAALAYKQIQGKKYATVVLIAPSHGAFIDGVSAFNGDCYETPLGRVPVDEPGVTTLADAASNIHMSSTGHESMGDRAEHSLEVQLPFLQMVLHDFKIVPLVFHDYSWDNCRQLGEAVATVFDPDHTLIVASSDLYHGHSYSECQRMDDATLHSMENDSPIQFCFSSNNQKVMACGAGPITALKIIAEKWGAQQPQVIARSNSADVTGAKGGYVVGYAAAVAVKS